MQIKNLEKELCKNCGKRPEYVTLSKFMKEWDGWCYHCIENAKLAKQFEYNNKKNRHAYKDYLRYGHPKKQNNC